MDIKQNPIGIFDSGVGGTSIWKEIISLLPHENTIYLADSKYAPYGERDPKEIIRLSIKNTEKLIQMQAKIIVVACNTATTTAIAILRSRYDIPFVGIEPAIKPAAIQTKTKTIGILATKGTLSSALFHQTAQIHAKNIRVLEVIDAGLVQLIEENKMQTPIMQAKLKKTLHPLLQEQIDYLVLGCSHYPYLIPDLKKIIPQHITIIDSGEAVARQTKKLLQQSDILLHTMDSSQDPSIGSNYQFFTNGNKEILGQILQDNRIKIKVDYLDF